MSGKSPANLPWRLAGSRCQMSLRNHLFRFRNPIDTIDFHIVEPTGTLQGSHGPQCCRIIKCHDYINIRMPLQHALHGRHCQFELSHTLLFINNLKFRMDP